MAVRNKEQAALAAAALPDDRAALLAEADAALRALHVAVIGSDDDGAEAATSRYDAAVWKLNGNTFSGCIDSSNPEAGGNLAQEHCRAAPGTVPLWGQMGEFLITVSGIRAVVEVEHGFSPMGVHFEFHVVDRNKPFISETGYRSHFADMQGGRTVDEAACAIFAAFLGAQRRLLSPEHRQRPDHLPARAWLLRTDAEAESTFEDADGQMAFGF